MEGPRGLDINNTHKLPARLTFFNTGILKLGSKDCGHAEVKGRKNNSKLHNKAREFSVGKLCRHTNEIKEIISKFSIKKFNKINAPKRKQRGRAGKWT